MKKITFLAASLFWFLPAVASAAEVFPSFPMSFWGTAKVDSVNVPTGTIIRVYAGAELLGQVTTDASGVYGYTESSRQKLVVKSGAGNIVFSFQHSALNSGNETKGTVEQSGGAFASGQTVNKDLTFSLVAQTPPTPPAPSGGGGGGGPASVPTNPYISILGGALTTPTTSVYLNLGASDAVQMLISNEPFFLNSVWLKYATTYPWQLSSDANVTKVVYVKYRSYSGGDSATVSDSIILSATSTTDTTIKNPVVISTTSSATGTRAVLGEKLTRLDELIKKLKPYKTAKEVPELQAELKKLGYFPKNLKFTSYYGATTVSGVRKYTDAKKKQALYVLIDSLLEQVKFGDKNATVKKLQQQLQVAGFYSKKVKITSKFDKYTQDSVKRFQASKKKK